MAYALARFTEILRPCKRESVKNQAVVGAVREPPAPEPVVGAVPEPPAPEQRPFSYRYDSSVSFLHPMPVA